MREVQAHIELKLVVPGLHVHAQLVERLVMLANPQVGQFMHGDHPEELRWRQAKQRRDPDFPAGLEPASLHPRARGVKAQRLLNQVDLAVEQHLVHSLGPAQMFPFESIDVLIQSPVAPHVVGERVPSAKVSAQARVVNQPQNLGLEVARIG